MKKLNKKLFSTAMAMVLGVSMLSTAGCGGDSGELSSSTLPSAEKAATSVQYVKAKTWDKVELHTYSLATVGEDVMPVGGFSGPYTPSGITYDGHVQPDFNDDKYWQLLKDCGVNNIVFAWNEYRTDTAAMHRALDQAQKFGMSYFVRDNYMGQYYNGSRSLEEVLAPYIDHPACAGIYGRDEPAGNEFEMYGRLINEFYANERFAGKDVYMNMLPNYAATAAFGKYMNYEDYIRGYMEVCHSIPYLCYDYYPYRTSTHNLDNMNAPNYFKNLSFIREVAMDNDVPFWAYYCVGEVGGTEYPMYPTKEGYFWNINTLLAYGAKGLQMYSVIQAPVDEDLTDAAADPEQGHNYERFGLIGAMGNINRWYYYQKEFAAQLQMIDEYLMNAQNVGVIGVGERARYLGDGPEVITSGTFRELKGVTANEAIVGCFDYNGVTMLYVMNNDIDYKQKITLNFDNNYGYDVYQRATLASVAGTSLTITLEGGEAALVKLRTK